MILNYKKGKPIDWEIGHRLNNFLNEDTEN